MLLKSRHLFIIAPFLIILILLVLMIIYFDMKKSDKRINKLWDDVSLIEIKACQDGVVVKETTINRNFLYFYIIEKFTIMSSGPTDNGRLAKVYDNSFYCRFLNSSNQELFRASIDKDKQDYRVFVSLSCGLISIKKIYYDNDDEFYLFYTNILSN